VQFSLQLRNLIRRSIDSVEHVEVLLLLKTHASRTWTAAEVAEELRRSPISVERRLYDLHRSKLLEVEDGRFSYRSGKHDVVIGELEQEFASRRVRLIELIFSRSIESARTFADAFRLWGEDDDHS
jgi:predicted ArsR family transcriptional regulator